MTRMQDNRQARKQASDHLSKAKQAGAKLMYNTKCYHARVVTARSIAKRTCRNMHMKCHTTTHGEATLTE